MPRGERLQALRPDAHGDAQVRTVRRPERKKQGPREQRFYVNYEISPDQKAPGPKETWWTSSSGERFSIVRYDENEYALASSDTFGTGDAEFWMPGLKLDDLARLIAIMQGVLDAKSAAGTKGRGNRKREWKRR